MQFTIYHFHPHFDTYIRNRNSINIISYVLVLSNDEDSANSQVGIPYSFVYRPPAHQTISLRGKGKDGGDGLS